MVFSVFLDESRYDLSLPEDCRCHKCFMWLFIFSQYGKPIIFFNCFRSDYMGDFSIVVHYRVGLMLWSSLHLPRWKHFRDVEVSLLIILKVYYSIPVTFNWHQGDLGMAYISRVRLYLFIYILFYLEDLVWNDEGWGGSP